MREIIAGAMVAGYATAALFFLRFWTQSRDRLFAIFSGAFWLLAAQRFLLALHGGDDGRATWYYGLRLLAYLLILLAIIDKNRGAAADDGGGGRSGGGGGH